MSVFASLRVIAADKISFFLSLLPFSRSMRRSSKEARDGQRKREFPVGTKNEPVGWFRFLRIGRVRFFSFTSLSLCI
jgi:hypothetical protein